MTPLIKTETIFLSGTDYVEDVMNDLYKRLKEMGFHPLWFRQPDFPHLVNDAMFNCLKVAETCDRMVVILDERAGLLYKKSGIPITEEEFNQAYKRGIPYLVFVRSKVWEHSKIYHRHLKQIGRLDQNAFKELRLDGDQAVYEFIERLQHLEKNGSSCVPWITPFMFSDGIIESIRGKWIPANIAGDDEGPLSEYPEPQTICSEEEFYRILTSFSDDLPNELLNQILRNIVKYAWSIIAYKPFFARDLINDEVITKSTLQYLIFPLCKIALNKEILPSELQSFIRLVNNNSAFFLDNQNKEHSILITRMLIHLLYNQPVIIKSYEFKEEFKRLSEKGEDFWDEFFVDLYFRYICNFLVISSELLPTIKDTFEKYLKNQNNKPLIRLWRLISLPWETSLNYKSDQLFNIIAEIARDCTSSIESKWCVSALLRILPLYKYSDEEIEYSPLVFSLIENFDLTLVKKSPQLQFVYLKNLLLSFIRTKNPEFLTRFEKQFTNSLCTLFPPQLSHLQLEYASCLYIACQFLEDEAIRRLKLGQIAELNEKPIENPLFNNPLLNFDIKLKISMTFDCNYKRTFFSWLIKYVNELYILYAKRFIEQNHLRVLQFKASQCVYENRKDFFNSVLTSLEKFINPQLNCPPSFYASSTATFSLIQRKQNINLIQEYVTRGLKADQYAILKNAKHIAQCLYSCYYYGKVEDRTEVDTLWEQLVEITKIGDSRPGLHWAYYAGVKFKIVDTERDFVDKLYESSREGGRKIYQLSLKKWESVDIEFSTKTMELIRRYSSKGSLLAAVLLNDLNNPEIWNIIGTTIFNNRKIDDVLPLEKASHFYAFARCLARTSKDYDQKYCYNYIRCKSLSYQAPGFPPGNSFIRDTANYLGKPESRLFAYKKECVQPYIDILEKDWKTIAPETQHHVYNTLTNIEWLRKTFSKQFSTIWGRNEGQRVVS